MKKLTVGIISILAAACLAGCMTPAQKQWTCETAHAAYGAYQSTIAAGHKPSESEVYAAAAGGTFLTIYCGWTSPVVAEPVVVRGAKVVTVPTVDVNWVPVLVPPK